MIIAECLADEGIARCFERRHRSACLRMATFNFEPTYLRPDWRWNRTCSPPDWAKGNAVPGRLSGGSQSVQEQSLVLAKIFLVSFSLLCRHLLQPRKARVDRRRP